MNTIFIRFIGILFLVASITSCSAKAKVTQLDPEKKCPVGEICASFTSGGMDAEGGGVQKGIFLIENEGQGSDLKTTKAKSVYASTGNDRFDTLGTAFLGSATHLIGVDMQGDAIKSAAKTTANGMVNAAKEEAKGGPDAVVYNSVGGASVMTTQSQSNQVGVGVSVSTNNPNPLN